MAIILCCVIGALVLMTFWIGIHGWFLAQTYREKAVQVKSIAGNEWRGKTYQQRFKEIDANYERWQLGIGTIGNVLIAVSLFTGDWHPEIAVPIGVMLSVFVLIKQVKVLSLMRLTVEDEFQLRNYVSVDKLHFLLELNDEKLSAGMLYDIAQKPVVSPTYLDSLYAMDDLLEQTYRTKVQLDKKEVNADFEHERAEMVEAYRVSSDILKPLLYTLLMAVGHHEQASSKEVKRKELIDQAMMLHRMATAFSEGDSYSGNPILYDLQRLIEDEDVPLSLKEKASDTLEKIQMKIEEALSEIQKTDREFDPESKIETAKRLYGITD